MRLPDFLIIGAARCGTTSLCEYLRRHPAVFMPYPLRPEPHFFLKDQEYHRGIAYYSQRYFKEAGPRHVAGEKSTSYLYQPFVAARIQAHLPQVKLIVALRNPIERAFSSFRFNKANGLESLSFSEAIRQEDNRCSHPQSAFEAEVQPYAYIGRGRYYEQLTRYLEYFPREQLHVMLFDDLTVESHRSYRDLLRFLGVDEGFDPGTLCRTFNSAPGDDEDNMSCADRAYIRSVLEEDISPLAQFLAVDLDRWR